MKVVVKDYLTALIISLSIYGIFSFIGNLYIDSFYSEIHSFTNVSDNIAKSIKDKRFATKYKLSTDQSKIDSSRIIPDSVIWVEKNSISYYRINKKGEINYISDTLLKNYIIHFHKMLDSASQTKTNLVNKSYDALLMDKSTQEILGHANSGYIDFVDRYPDTLLVQTFGEELVFKGKICLIKEN